MLRGVDLDLPAHTLIRIEGANGSGKSTLLRLLAGIDAPTEGRITGRRSRTAYVPERFPAALPFTAGGYLVHLGRIHGLRTAEATGRAQAWLARFGAADHARTPLSELSKGTSQKVAVAQALLAEPELLVLDEAWTGLDTAARDELDRAVAERVTAGATVVFVDHDPHAAGGRDRHHPPGRGARARPRSGAGGGVRDRAAGTDRGHRCVRDHPSGWAAGRPRAGTRTRRHPAAHGRGRALGRATSRPADGPAAVAHPAAVGGGSTGTGTPNRIVPDPMTALIRYQAALLLRSQRWLAPVLLYAVLLAVGVQSGQPVLDSLGYAAAALLPVTAWLVQLCATQEPPAARTVAAAVAGQPKVHLASLLTAVGCVGILGTAATAIVLLISDPANADHTVRVPLLLAGLAGLLAAACCALLGAAVGALCTRPVLHRRGWSIAATALAALLSLVTTGSPAKYAVTGLVTGSVTGAVHIPVVPLICAAAVAAAVGTVVCKLTSLRDSP